MIQKNGNKCLQTIKEMMMVKDRIRLLIILAKNTMGLIAIIMVWKANQSQARV